ncbi:hypothetical protein AWR38_27910 [Idiomarina sp. WRN-38]|uniref:hypothetical protein n=1 Tax=Idiomarina sp. OXR-189 TaxID=3100175 RepID=UPI0007334E62|nr:hypothetical protein [Idiomarina sp. OXR-189]KTG28660.1 hypothetical protein AUR68_27870 [Idiomarina sp. H105]OAF08531.1 hypothetical protein AWR38_27910 [Idiomarina sp. WRN-38]WPZ00796.1 hypothetical protein UM402_09960 [Idiomarina sp. OXR-189]
MKKFVLSTALIASGSLFFSAASNADSVNYISGGFNDFYNSDFYVEGSTSIADNWVGEVQFTDMGDYSLRAGAKYFLDMGADRQFDTFLKGGVSHYDFGNYDDTSAYAGIGAMTKLSQQTTAIVDAGYDWGLDGFASVGARLRYAFTDRFSADAGFRGNFNSIDNEVHLGVTYSF